MLGQERTNFSYGGQGAADRPRQTSQAVYSKCKGPEAETGVASRTGVKAREAGVVVVGRKEAGSDGSRRIFW